MEETGGANADPERIRCLISDPNHHIRSGLLPKFPEAEHRRGHLMCNVRNITTTNEEAIMLVADCEGSVSQPRSQSGVYYSLLLLPIQPASLALTKLRVRYKNENTQMPTCR